MRQKEIDSGIQVFAQDSLDPESLVGVSKICAKQAVRETALSRVSLSLICTSMAAFSILSLSKLRPLALAMAKS